MTRLAQTRCLGRNRWRGSVVPVFFAAALIVMAGLKIADGAPAVGPLVGAYYYGWYGDWPGGHTTSQSLGAHLIPQRHPTVGANYSSRDPNVIAAHIDQSHLGNVDFWSLSWWGPDNHIDTTNLDYIMAHPRAGEMKFTVHYESPGRLGNSNNALTDYTNLLPDFRYLAQHYFSNPNYLRVDGKPVVNVYGARGYFDISRGEQALQQMRDAIRNEFGYNLYLIGDDISGSSYSSVSRAHQWDAVTGYSPPNYVKETSGDGVPDSYFQGIQNGYDAALQNIALSNARYGTHTQLIPSAGLHPGGNRIEIERIGGYCFGDDRNAAAPCTKLIF